ncbi:Phosphoglycerate mutase family protein [Hirschfeldia incana]|nr:Phosphoglycerate mutase family protein [Hirschfeldia incana]
MDSYQHVFVMRHGDRLDNFDRHWADTAARPWDTPLYKDGMVRAFQTGQRIRSQNGFPIHRVFVSPFFRCVQTASNVVAALYAPTDLPSVDKSKLVKVAIEYGLCEMMNSFAIWPEVSPKDGKFEFNISDLEALFPEGMFDHNVDPVYKEMPKWKETVEACRERYVKVVKALADKYPTENLLLVTHGEGLETTFSTFNKNTTVNEVDYCAYVQLRRHVSCKDGDVVETGEYEVSQTGIRFSHDPVVSRPMDSCHQHVFVMSHGDRLDNFDPLWAETAARPWDPPLILKGMVRAFRTGQSILSQTGFPIHRIFVSPFLRCVQTASKVVGAFSLSAPRHLPSVDKSNLVKVAIEYGLCEMMNSVATLPEVSPKDGKFDFNISDLEALFPEGVVDHNVDPIYREMPEWEETKEDCRERYVKVVNTLADKYPTENLLLITHGGGLETTFSAFYKDTTVHEVDYCAYVELRREVLSKDGDVKIGEYVVSQTGIKFSHDLVINRSLV